MSESTVAPGWYPDPNSDGARRWWDGRQWGPPAPVPVPAAVPAPPGPGAAPPATFAPSPSAPAWDPYVTARPSPGPQVNRVARSGAWLGGVSMLGVPLACVLGWVFSGIGLSRAMAAERTGRGPFGLGTAIAGLVMSAIGTVVSIWVLIWAFQPGGPLSMVPAFDEAATEHEIETGIHDQLGMTVDVDCPPDPSMQQGSVFECLVTADGTMLTTVTVTVQDRSGYIIWRTN